MRNLESTSTAGDSRRRFLATTGSTVAVASLAAPAVHAAGTDELRLGLVGCGGRGTGAALQALSADPQTRLVAVADAFAEPMYTCLQSLSRQNNVADRISVQSEHRFGGFDGYQRLIDSDVDIVLLCTPPHFRPMHLRAALEEVREPIILANILVPQAYVGAVIGLCEEKRGVQKNMQYLGGQVSISYELPMSEVVLDFFDRLKSVSRGFASFDYHFQRFQEGPFVRVDLLINGEKVDALSIIVHRDNSQRRGRELAERMRELIPRQMFEVAIQAAIGSHVIARTTVKAMRKNVLAKCYGGDVSRKRKLLEKQKAGKKRMKMVGKVEIPQEAFLAVLRNDD